MRETPIVTVAYADDHIAVRKGIIALTEQIGGIKVIIEADNGKDLLEQLERAKELPNVIMLDINMPGMNGFETLKVLKEKWPDIKTLAFTTFNSEVYLIRMISLGVNSYLLKNCHPQEIKQAVISLYKHGYYYSDAVDKSFYKKVASGKIKLPHFTENEMNYLKYCPTELSYSQIANRMGTTVKAIEGYRDRLCDKLHVKGRVSLALYAIQFGLVQMQDVLQTNPYLQ